MIGRQIAGLAVAALLCAPAARAQDGRTEYPRLLAGGFAELHIGHINYPFTTRQLEPGYQAESIDVPNLAVQVSLGHRFTDRLSIRLNYLRPVQWVLYRNVNGDGIAHSVWMNVTSLTLTRRVPVGHGASIYGEAGMGAVTRHGIALGDGSTVVRNAVYPTAVLGAGVERRLNSRWALDARAVFLPSRPSQDQPHTFFYSGGATYRLEARPEGTAPRAGEVAAIFPRRLVQLGYTTSAFGFGFNRAMTPVFWQGETEVARGVTLHYQRNVFHTERIFSLDWGASLAYGLSRRRHDEFTTLSFYPLFRFTVLRRPDADLYATYSLAGPTLISKFIIDGHETGRHFTLQDLLGVGVYWGRDRRFNAEVRIAHYSNGNLLPRNSGIRVPMTVNLGYAFR